MRLVGRRDDGLKGEAGRGKDWKEGGKGGFTKKKKRTALLIMALNGHEGRE